MKTLPSERVPKIVLIKIPAANKTGGEPLQRGSGENDYTLKLD